MIINKSLYNINSLIYLVRIITLLFYRKIIFFVFFLLLCFKQNNIIMYGISNRLVGTVEHQWLEIQTQLS